MLLAKLKNKMQQNTHILVILFFCWIVSISGYILMRNVHTNKSSEKQNIETSPGYSPTPAPLSGMKISGYELIDTKLGIHVDTSQLTFLSLGQSPIEQDYGVRVDIQWQGAAIAGGKFFDKNGKLLDYKEVAKAYRYSDDIKDVQIDETTYLGLPAAYLEVTSDTIPHQYFQPFSLLAVQKGPLVYVFETDSKTSLNQLLGATSFYDSNTIEKRKIPSNPAQTKVKMFIPESENKKIFNVKTPTFIGKITQGTEQFLPSTYELSSSAYNEEMLQFQLGYKSEKVQHLTVFIDGVQMKDIYGFPQFPVVVCQIHHNAVNYGDYFDSQLYAGSRNTEPILTQEECIGYKAIELPPVVFMFTPREPLSEGAHTLTIKTAKGLSIDTPFTIQTTLAKGKLPIPTAGSIFDVPEYTQMDAGDKCMPGYYYDPIYLRMPLPTLDNKSLVYALHFPQSANEKRIYDKDTEVYMKFDDTYYPFHLPQSSVFYFPDEKVKIDGREYLRAEKALYIPKDRLYFQDGTKAIILEEEGYDASTYQELYPVDAVGAAYPNSVFPWTTSGSSGCDG